MTENILFLDLDGTIRHPKSGNKFISYPEDQRPIPEAKEAIADYASKGYLIVGITNQGGVAAGHKTQKSCIAEQQYTFKLFPQIHSILFCPDFAGNECWRCCRDEYYDCSSTYPDLIGTYRKPGSGILHHILISNEVDPRNCLMVGDRPEDEGCANAAGVEFLWAFQWIKAV
ncbi:MAG: HAD-IIIA family hydrolase [Okeania sp. SIO2D1]|nr:HAD-IIIA family hydrolase [Okeania sp. SIO2D1]